MRGGGDRGLGESGESERLGGLVLDEVPASPHAPLRPNALGRRGILRFNQFFLCVHYVVYGEGGVRLTGSHCSSDYGTLDTRGGDTDHVLLCSTCTGTTSVPGFDI
eukprot:scaffold8307_cov119-Isochrysis_galbana.AAC.13